MAAIVVGSVCRKNRGRDSRKKCVVVNLVDANYVEIICIGRKKRRRCNIKHLEPLGGKIELKGSDDEIRKALESA
ncbi:MAG: LSU ribosomal protein L14e [Candidatus Fermentimicrarchaeum limneticum]|uniref:LSU ribosomal protein L14e n=1 Tax=Fermentimicrarchaeum limneticum TaxID=2795018 RepID=A0A7D6BCD0_FERL1|nr:MAG: LSU ribosomal protein L14e [Candidatus Fermentimicrarchaeum limneticum]